MIYPYYKEIVNYEKNVNKFYDKKNFVGFILPNGLVYKAKEHSVTNVENVFKVDLSLLKEHFEDKNEILGETKDALCQLISNFFNNISYEKVVALNKFMDDNELLFSEVLVSLFGCHLITRIGKGIITSEDNHELFYNYILEGFEIKTIDRIVYDKEKKQYVFMKKNNRNTELYGEIEEIINQVPFDETPLFRK